MLKNDSVISPTKQEIDITNGETFDFIQSTRRDYIQQRDRSLTEENETERVACSQLMLVSTVLLSANVIALTNSSLLTSLSPAQKILLLVGVVLLVGSIFSGVKYYFVLVRFHLKWATAHNDVVNLHSRVDFKTFDEAGKKTDAILEKLPTLTPKLWLKRQIGMLAGGGAAYVLLLVAILFNFHFITTHLWNWIR